MKLPVAWSDVVAARERLEGHVHRTPVLTSRTLDEISGAAAFFKCENFQRTGSFKFRGALNAIAALAPAERLRGVCSHSSGNHAQALALAARLHHIPVYVVMPEDAAPSKIAATEAYGAEVTFCSPTHTARCEAAESVLERTRARFIDSHDDPAVIAGQATAVCELLGDIGDLDLVLAPVGGGGLLAGTLIAVRKACPRARIVGCEPAGADDAARSLERGERIVDFVPRTIADGLRTPLGENTFEIIRRLVDDIVVVPEEEILPAMRRVWERLKIVIEPSSAVAVAPLLSGSVGQSPGRVGVLLSGGNVDIDRMRLHPRES